VGAAAADANEGVEAVAAEVGGDDIGHVGGLAIDAQAVGFVTTGAEDGAADGEDAGQGRLVEFAGLVVDQPAEAVFETDHLDPAVQRGLADRTDGGVEAGAVAPGC